MKLKLGKSKSLFSSLFFLMLTMTLLFSMVYGIRYVCYKQGDAKESMVSSIKCSMLFL